MQIEYRASKKVEWALETLGRTEDVKFSPNSRRLAIAGFGNNSCLVVDINFQNISDGKQVLLTDCVEVTSPSLNSPHGLAFIDDETLIVANRSGAMPVLKLPSSGMGEKAIAVTPIRTIRGGLFSKLKSPGSVTIIAHDGEQYEALVCNNYVHRVTRHILDGRKGFRARRNQILLREGLNVPDGVAVSPDQRWIAISNHSEQEVLLFENSKKLNPRSRPDGVLRKGEYPHGLCFTPDGKYIVVADAGRPFVHIYAKGGSDWRSDRDPVGSVRIMGTEAFLRGRYNSEEGGPKGIDIDNSGNLFVATSEHQPLAFFDLSEMLDTSNWNSADMIQMDRATKLGS